jgi:hypothetical protein
MAKATIVEVKPVKPDEKVMLELSIQEAALLYAITGSTAASGKVGENLGHIYHVLKEIPRVSTYGNDVIRHIFKDQWQMYIREANLPEEK